MLLRHPLTLSTLILTSTSLSPQTPLSASPHKLSISPPQKNAPQIFNAIQSSMRQWGSSLKHNGMSFFPASIPNNTQLYHGTHTAEPVMGLEWLAFEIEHAEAFARPRGGPPPGKGGPGRRPGGPPPGEGGAGEGDPGYGPPPPMMGHRFVPGDGEGDKKGYLHIYRTTRTLSNLLYIDGMSAGKTSMGTLDTQDLILRNLTNSSSDINTAPWSDLQRAIDLCAWGKKNNIEGFIRMEMGFELILCDFSNGLQFVAARDGPNYTREQEERENIFTFEYARGVAMRYGGITAKRVKVDFSRMVSAFFYDLNLTNPDETKAALPRLPADDIEGLDLFRKDVLRQIAEKERGESVDWQGVVDLIVTRYSDRLQYMAMNESTNTTLLAEANFLLGIHINHEEPDNSAPIERCSTHYLNSVIPQTSQDFLIRSAIQIITQRICRTLFQVRDLLTATIETKSENSITEAKSLLKDLIAILDWSTWLECGKCAYDEVCFVAIWPMGAVEDHAHPGCIKSTELTHGRQGYWGRGGPGRPGKEEL